MLGGDVRHGQIIGSDRISHGSFVGFAHAWEVRLVQDVVLSVPLVRPVLRPVPW